MIAALLAVLTVGTRAVTFSVTATGVSTNQPVEFLFADRTSDRAYETLFLTDETIGEISAALKKAGFPKGGGYDVAACRFWPTGPVVTFEPDVRAYFTDIRGDLMKLPYVLTGGNADTNMPAAVFALYDCGQSLVQVDDVLNQSQVYGRFLPTKPLEKGTRFKFTIRWDGKTETHDMTPDFPADKTVGDAKRVADALAEADSRKAKINGFREGQFYYGAFRPLVKWRDRKERLVQPLEVRVAGTNVTYTIVKENWDVEGVDPELNPVQVSFADALKFKGDTCFFFVRKDEKLGTLYALKAKLPKTIRNWYIYID